MNTTVDVVTLVNQDIVAAARATIQRTNSPYFGQALLRSKLTRLRYHVSLLAERRPDQFTALAEHLRVAPDLDEVLDQIDQTAQDVLAAFYRPGTHHNLNCSP